MAWIIVEHYITFLLINLQLYVINSIQLDVMDDCYTTKYRNAINKLKKRNIGEIDNQKFK